MVKGLFKDSDGNMGLTAPLEKLKLNESSQIAWGGNSVALGIDLAKGFIFETHTMRSVIDFGLATVLMALKYKKYKEEDSRFGKELVQLSSSLFRNGMQNLSEAFWQKEFAQMGYAYKSGMSYKNMARKFAFRSPKEIFDSIVETVTPPPNPMMENNAPQMSRNPQPFLVEKSDLAQNITSSTQRGGVSSAGDLQRSRPMLELRSTGR